MCIIATKPSEVSISKEILQNCFENNNDGAGFMFSNNGILFAYFNVVTWPHLLNIPGILSDESPPIILHNKSFL